MCLRHNLSKDHVKQLPQWATTSHHCQASQRNLVNRPKNNSKLIVSAWHARRIPGVSKPISTARNLFYETSLPKFSDSTERNVLRLNLRLVIATLIVFTNELIAWESMRYFVGKKAKILSCCMSCWRLASWWWLHVYLRHSWMSHESWKRMWLLYCNIPTIWP